MTSKRLLWLLPLPLLCVLGAWGSAHVADRIGIAISRALGAVAPFLVTHPHEEPEPESFVDAPSEAAVLPVSIVTPAPATKGRRTPPRTKTKAEVHSLFVSAETVLRLAEARVRPRGVPVKAEGQRPAGLRLSNVGALGIGLHEGDVLTRAVGQPALSSSAVVSAVLVARARGAKVLEGEFWRAGERWVLQVEQPYLTKK